MKTETRRGWLAAALVLWPLAGVQAQQACTTTGTNQTCTNSVTITGGAAGIVDSSTLTITNTATGAISGEQGINAFNVNATNFGTIRSTGVFGDAISSVSDAKVTNFGSIVATGEAGFGIAVGRGAANVTNFGTISATGPGASAISASSSTVNNSGTIQATDIGIDSSFQGNVTNSGTIRATGVAGRAINVGLANVANTGIIQATGSSGIAITSISANVTNSGVIQSTSPFGIAILAGSTSNVTNSGTIIGDTALAFSGPADTLTLLPGSKIVGAIDLGSGDTINFRGGNHNLTFNALSGTTVTGTTPFAVAGGRAVAVDPTLFAATPRTLTDFTRAAADAVPVFGGNTARGGPLAFAAPDTSSRIDDAFAAIPGLSAYSGEGAVFKAPTSVYSDGTAVWARGFGGQRIQQQDGPLLHNANLFFGGMIGADFAARPDLRYGVYLGGGKTRTSLDLNQGGSDSDLIFGGAYARYDMGQTFLHAAVQGGGSRNSATRTVNNNLAVNGIETAAASFNGWYLSPEVTIGHRLALGTLADAAYTLTPSLRVRYLYGAYEGYTETGTTAPLTVDGQTVSVWEERGEVKLTRTVSFNSSDQLSTSIAGGVLGTQRAGGSTISATLLGQAIPFATPGAANSWGAVGGLGLEWQMRNVTLFSAAEYIAFSDNANVISGRAGLRVKF